MVVKSDVVPTASEASAHRRWLITIAISVLFGGFGAVMAYLSYANSTRATASSSGRSRSPARSPSTAPSSAPAAPPTIAPPAVEPSSDDGKHDKGKSDKDK